MYIPFTLVIHLSYICPLTRLSCRAVWPPPDCPPLWCWGPSWQTSPTASVSHSAQSHPTSSAPPPSGAKGTITNYKSRHLIHILIKMYMYNPKYMQMWEWYTVGHTFCLSYFFSICHDCLILNIYVNILPIPPMMLNLLDWPLTTMLTDSSQWRKLWLYKYIDGLLKYHFKGTCILLSLMYMYLKIVIHFLYKYNYFTFTIAYNDVY